MLRDWFTRWANTILLIGIGVCIVFLGIQYVQIARLHSQIDRQQAAWAIKSLAAGDHTRTVNTALMRTKENAYAADAINQAKLERQKAQLDVAQAAVVTANGRLYRTRGELAELRKHVDAYAAGPATGDTLAASRARAGELAALIDEGFGLFDEGGSLVTEGQGMAGSSAGLARTIAVKLELCFAAWPRIPKETR